MPGQFEYQAVSKLGEISRGSLAAADMTQVEEYLIAQGLKPITIRPSGRARAGTSFGLRSRARYEELIMFTNALATMHRAGVPLLKALSIIKVGSADQRFTVATERIRGDVQAGKSLSAAMAEHEKVFSKVYLASVAAGEESGRLEDTLDELSAMLEKEMELNRQVKAAVRYPLVVMGIIIAAVVVLMVYVVPTFVDFYEGFGAELPLPTRIVIGISNLFTRYWLLAAAAVTIIVLSLRRVFASQKGRFWLDRQLLRTPIAGDILAKGNVARFALMFQILLKAGIPMVRSLNILGSAVTNLAISREISKMGTALLEGRELDGAPGEFEHFPELARNMMAIGMESGSLDRMVGEIGSHYSKEVLYRSRQLTSILEPILTIVLGVFVLILALAVFLPMWSLIRVFHG
jgi:MSHA biogenesis protein MshG